MSVKKTIKEDDKDAIVLPLIVVGVIIVGILSLYFLQKMSYKNSKICTYLGRLWMPDKESGNPNIFKCYTYEEYYK